MRALFSRRFPDVNKIIFSKRAFSGETDFVDKFILFQDSDKDRQRRGAASCTKKRVRDSVSPGKRIARLRSAPFT